MKTFVQAVRDFEDGWHIALLTHESFLKFHHQNVDFRIPVSTSSITQAVEFLEHENLEHKDEIERRATSFTPGVGIVSGDFFVFFRFFSRTNRVKLTLREYAIITGVGCALGLALTSVLVYFFASPFKPGRQSAV